MKRNMKTLLMGTVALMAGVGLASAQGMRDVPSAGERGASSNSSDQMAPGKSGSHREMKGGAERGKSETSEPRGQAQRGPSDKDMSKGQAKSERHERSTTGQGASDKDELKSKSSAKPEKSTTGQAVKDSTKDKADTGKSAAEKKSEKSTTGQASKDKTEKSTTGQGSTDTKASSGSKAPDTKASSDSKAQTPQNRQSQDPNAAKQNQTTGSSTQSSSTTEQSNAGIRSQAGVQVSSQQRTTIQQSVLSARNVPRVDRVSFSIHTGTVVPRDVRIVSVTTFPALIEVFPRYREYSFFVVEDEIVFVDRSHKIVDVVPVGGGGHFARSSSTTTVAVDLTEPEIREIQLVLIKRGYFHGRADGVWSPTVREALITFQRKEGFEATGRIDTRTVTALGLEGKVKVKSESSSSSSSGQSSPTTGQGATQNGAQKPDEKSTTGQAAPSSAQKNAAPAKGPSEQKGSNNAQPTPTTPKDQRSAAPGKSTTGQGSSEKSTQPGMSDQKTGPSQSPAASEQNDKRRQ
jgi:Putative peptidoglycan binding domain/Protein of unknown function (DUF1236)